MYVDVVDAEADAVDLLAAERPRPRPSALEQLVGIGEFRPLQYRRGSVGANEQRGSRRCWQQMPLELRSCLEFSGLEDRDGGGRRWSSPSACHHNGPTALKTCSEKGTPPLSL